MVAIDTFQIVRANTTDTSYANDYDDVRQMKQLFNSYYGKEMSAKSLKQMMNRWRYSLEEQGVQFTNRRSNGQRLVDISYSSDRDESAVSDVKILDGKSCVPSVPCAPVSERVALSAKTAESTRQQNRTANFGNRRQM